MQDQLLLNKIKNIVFNNDAIEIASIKTLLDNGANPLAKIESEKSSAYDVVKQNNQHGEFNALIEEFDFHIQTDLRESDSIEEGMHITDNDES